MKKVYYTQQPEPLHIQRHGSYIHVALALHPTASDDTQKLWEADSHQFWEQADVLDLNDVQANPEQYLNYIPHASRQELKDKAQQMLDALRTACPVVAVPSYREGASVCNRPADQVKLVAGLILGGLPYYELANGEIVNLSEADIKAIATDITAAETAWQQAKQQCWAAIDAADGKESLNAALSQFAATLGTSATISPAPLSGNAALNNTGWLSGLLQGWNLSESWAKILTGSIAGALASASLLSGCSTACTHESAFSLPPVPHHQCQQLH